MSASGGSDEDVAALVGELVDTLQELEAEVAPTTERGFPRPPTPSELLRFTSDVAIPGAILILRTNVEALKLLRRALRLADGRSPTADRAGAVRAGAERVSRETLSRLDDALGELQDTVAGRPPDDDARVLLDRARELRSDVVDAIGDPPAENGDDPSSASGVATDDPLQSGSSVAVDVDAELQSIKADLDEVDEDAPGDTADDDVPGDASDGEAPGDASDGEAPGDASDGKAPGDASDGKAP